MRPSAVLRLIVGLFLVFPHFISAASLPPPTRSVNPLLVPRDLSLEAQVCADVDVNISVWALGGLFEIDIDLQVCLCVHAVVQYVNGRNDIPADCKADASEKITAILLLTILYPSPRSRTMLPAFSATTQLIAIQRHLPAPHPTNAIAAVSPATTAAMENVGRIPLRAPARFLVVLVP
ncbi:hypothetical protein FRC00_002099 [Tulasnella sp. 408]|nr:hypothetical protein FRC00_002099 [Tulasnella sp. 408]